MKKVAIILAGGVGNRIGQDIAEIVGKKVIFYLTSEAERKGYSTATKSIMDGSKIKELGFKVESDFKTRLEETIEVLRSIRYLLIFSLILHIRSILLK